MSTLRAAHGPSAPCGGRGYGLPGGAGGGGARTLWGVEQGPQGVKEEGKIGADVYWRRMFPRDVSLLDNFTYRNVLCSSGCTK